jgi:hypothetical protein
MMHRKTAFLALLLATACAGGESTSPTAPDLAKTTITTSNAQNGNHMCGWGITNSGPFDAWLSIGGDDDGHLILSELSYLTAGEDPSWPQVAFVWDSDLESVPTTYYGEDSIKIKGVLHTGRSFTQGGVPVIPWFATGPVDTTRLELPVDLTIQFQFNTPETGGKHTGTIGVSGTINGFPVGTGSQIVNRWIAVRQQHPRKGGIGHFSKNDWFGAEGGNVSFCQGKQK